MTKQVCCHYLVSGRVQGVGYRYFVQRIADQLSLSGWVRNLDDGRVELVACGSESVLAQLEQRLQQGPPSSRVTEVVTTAVDPIARTDFDIL